MSGRFRRPPWGVMLFIACVLFISGQTYRDVPGVWHSVDVAGHELLAAAQASTATAGLLLIWPLWMRRARFAPLLLAWAALLTATGTIAATIFTPGPQRLLSGASAFGGTLLIAAFGVYWPWRWLRGAPSGVAADPS